MDKLILDHHLLRSRDGLCWLRMLSKESGRDVLCAAQFMDCEPLLLEADRSILYEQMPVLPGWHEEYAEGKVMTKGFSRFLM